MERPYSESEYDLNYEEYQNYTRAKNHYNILGFDF